MNSIHLEHSPNHNYPAIELDMTDFVEHLSEEYLHGKVDLRDDGIQTNPKIIGYKSEDCTNLGGISSISVSGLTLEERVRNFNYYYLMFIVKQLIDTNLRSHWCCE